MILIKVHKIWNRIYLTLKVNQHLIHFYIAPLRYLGRHYIWLCQQCHSFICETSCCFHHAGYVLLPCHLIPENNVIIFTFILIITYVRYIKTYDLTVTVFFNFVFMFLFHIFFFLFFVLMFQINLFRCTICPRHTYPSHILIHYIKLADIPWDMYNL